MPFDQQIKGDPFRGDYPGRQGHEPWDEVEAHVQRGVIDLAQRRYEPGLRQTHYRLLNRRRQAGLGVPHEPQSHTRGFPAHTVAEIAVLPVDVGFDTLLTEGELLITRESYDGKRSRDDQPGAGAKGYLDSFGIRASEVDCAELAPHVMRLTPSSDMSPQELAHLARTLRAQGMSASLNHVTLAAGQPHSVVKARAMPEPVGPPPGPPQFGDGNGTPARVAIIDTGLAHQQRDDRWLQGVIGDDDPLDRFPAPNGDGYLDLAAGHGTFVAGIVRQVAPRAQVKIYRAVDSDGVGTEVSVACEMIRAVKEDEAQIINLSLGFQTHDGLPPLAIQTALDVIGEWERDNGRDVLVIAAAGNYADTTPCWPAAFRRVVSVAALAPDMRPAPWSSRGFWITCSTIGQGVRSTYVQGQESPLLYTAPATFGRDAWAVWSGTSFTAPQIAGAVARLHEQHGYPVREALGKLLAAGQPVAGFGQALKILPGS